MTAGGVFVCLNFAPGTRTGTARRLSVHSSRWHDNGKSFSIYFRRPLLSPSTRFPAQSEKYLPSPVINFVRRTDIDAFRVDSLHDTEAENAIEL